MNQQGVSFRLAISEFHRARQKAAMQQILGRFTGRSAELLSFDEVATKLKTTDRMNRGLQVIPVGAIVGSVGRYSDFTRTFLPRLASDSQRWASVKSAASHISELPPIEVYQLGTAYFVLDGNHRVSIARQQGVDFIDAYVTEVHTIVPFDSEDSPDDLILKAEYAEFLEHTRLDRLRPETDFTVSAPGQYASLENHLEIHRYLHEVEQEAELTDEEAAIKWHDEAYLPVAEAIREQGIMHYFPGRTETDFYVWLATHQAALRNDLGWRTTPAAVVTKLASQFNPETKHPVTRVGRRILRAVVPEHLKGRQKKLSWAQTKAMARYGGYLFQDLLVAVRESEHDLPELAQAIELAKREGARIHGIRITPDDAFETVKDDQTTRQRLEQRCVQEGVSVEWVSESGDPLEKIFLRARLADLVVLDKSYLSTGDGQTALEAGLASLVQLGSCPILIVPGKASPMRRILLAYDDQTKSREALFLATYFAECWRSSLTVVTVLETLRAEQDMIAHARQYLEMHEIAATFISGRGRPGEVVNQVASDHDADLILLGSRGDGRIGKTSVGGTLWRLVRETDWPLLISP